MKAQVQGRQQYLQQRIESASPIERLVILFDACDRFLAQSEQCFLNKDHVNFLEKNIRAQHIIRELRQVLDFKKDKEIAGRLYQVYTYMLMLLKKSGRERSIEMLRQVKGMVQEIGDSWRAVIRQQKEQIVGGVSSQEGRGPLNFVM